MLGHTYRFTVTNNTASAVGCVIQARRWKFGTDGSLSFDSEDEEFNDASISAAATDVGSTEDNSSGKWIGADLEVTITPSGSVTGLVSVQIERSTDGGTTWPTAGLGEVVAGHYFSASSSAVALSVSI